MEDLSVLAYGKDRKFCKSNLRCTLRIGLRKSEDLGLFCHFLDLADECFSRQMLQLIAIVCYKSVKFLNALHKTILFSPNHPDFHLFVLLFLIFYPLSLFFFQEHYSPSLYFHSS